MLLLKCKLQMKPLYNYTPCSLANFWEPNKIHGTCIGYTEAKIFSTIIKIQLSVFCAHNPFLFSGSLISMHYVMITNNYGNVYCSDYSCMLCICILIEKCITNTAGAIIKYAYNIIKIITMQT